jgi:hypothetical protein
MNAGLYRNTILLGTALLLLATLSSGSWGHTDREQTDVSEGHIVPIVMVEEYAYFFSYFV